MDDVLGAAEALLADLEDAETGGPLVSGVIRTADEFPGWTRLPELLVDWATDRPVSHARHRQFGDWRGPPPAKTPGAVPRPARQTLRAGPSGAPGQRRG